MSNWDGTLADEARHTARVMQERETARLRAENRDLRALVERQHDAVGRLQELLDLIPPCPLHGRGCHKHALAWVRAAAKLAEAFDAATALREGTHP